MKCQFCGQNEAENSYIIVMMGEESELHLCNDCAARARQYHEALMRGTEKQGTLRRLDSTRFPADAGPDVRRRRKLNGLVARLNEAVAGEDYEEAARLRDKIALVKKEIFVYEQ